MKFYSPFRYPGGKGKLLNLIQDILYENDLQGGQYIEPFAGGAAVALGLLAREHVDSVCINDADYRIFSVWKSITTRGTQFVDMIENTPVSIKEWTKQKEIYNNPNSHSRIKVGFATFYLNRCNRSGIIKGGAIGGVDQKGKWKIDARFNKEDLIKRVEFITANRDRIEVHNLDALDLLREVNSNKMGSEPVVYLDPPYYIQGHNLYLNHYKHGDHSMLSKYIIKDFKKPWVMTYDNVPPIRDLYKSLEQSEFLLRYSAFESRKGKEVLIRPKQIKVPMEWLA